MAGFANNNNPFQSQVRLGVQAIQLVPGPPGPAGATGGVVTTTANFTQPAAGANVTASVSTVVGLASGETVFVAGGGFYSVFSVGGSSIVLTNLGTTGNTAPGLNVTSGALVVGSGPPTPSLLTVTNGGTGVVTLAAHAVVIGEGTSPVATAGPGTTGQVLTSNGASADPTFQALPATTFPAPGSTISSATVLGATQLWALFTGGTYAIDSKNIAAGAPFYLTYVTGGGLLENTAVTIHDTSGSYGSVEYPANRSLPLLASQPLDVSWRTYVFCKDATNGVVRCIGFA